MSIVTEMERKVCAMPKDFRDWFAEYYHAACSAEGRSLTDAEIQISMDTWNANHESSNPTADEMERLLDELLDRVHNDALFLASGTPAGNSKDPNPKIQKLRTQILAALSTKPTPSHNYDFSQAAKDCMILVYWSHDDNPRKDRSSDGNYYKQGLATWDEGNGEWFSEDRIVYKLLNEYGGKAPPTWWMRWPMPDFDSTTKPTQPPKIYPVTDMLNNQIKSYSTGNNGEGHIVFDCGENNREKFTGQNIDLVWYDDAPPPQNAPDNRRNIICEIFTALLDTTRLGSWIKESEKKRVLVGNRKQRRKQWAKIRNGEQDD